MIDLTNELRVAEFTTNEFLAFLSDQFSTSRLGRSSHTAIFGADELRVTFKSGERRIVKVMGKASARKELATKVKEALSPDASLAVTSQVVMSQGQFELRPFRWCGKWQVGRMPAGAPIPSELLGLFPVLMQYQHRKVGMLGLDTIRRGAAFRRAFLPLVPITQWWTNGLLDPAPATTQKTWAIMQQDESGGGTGVISRWVQMGYLIPDGLLRDGFHEYSAPARAEWTPDTFDPTDFFRCAAQKWLGRFEQLTGEAEEQFLRGCYWFNKALTARSHTDILLALIIMIESFLPKDADCCETCSQPVYSISERFRNFLDRHGGPGPTGTDEEREQFKRFSSRLYKLRSAVAHGGFAVAAEELGFGSGFVPKDWSEEELVSDLRTIGSRLLLSWLDEKTATAPLG